MSQRRAVWLAVPPAVLAAVLVGAWLGWSGRELDGAARAATPSPAPASGTPSPKASAAAATWAATATARPTATPSPLAARAAAEAEAAKLLPEVKARVEDLGDEFRARRVGYYVVAGDLPARQLESYCRETVEACDRLLHASLFERYPDRAITIYLFRDEKSYDRGVKALYGGEPTTPFGFYVDAERALYMNIGTGGGTLVHELTHALMDADSPDAPCWIFEGLGSLYEQCGLAEDRLVGYLNWRLPGLQQGLEEKRFVPFRELAAKSYADFAEGEESGMLYAESRYLMLWLQQQGALLEFWRQFRAGRADDPDGVKTFERLVGRSLEELEPDWRAWVKRQRWKRTGRMEAPVE